MTDVHKIKATIESNGSCIREGFVAYKLYGMYTLATPEHKVIRYNTIDELIDKMKELYDKWYMVKEVHYGIH